MPQSSIAGVFTADQLAAQQRHRILLIGFNYAPELTGIGPYTTALAEHYAALGHSVRVITGIPHYPEWRPMAVAPMQPGSNPAVSRYSHFIPRRPNAAGRILYEVSWLASAGRALPRSACDVVIGVIPNLAGGMLAWLVGRSFHVPVGLILKDLLGPAALQSGYQGGGAVAGLTTAIERYLIRRADRVAVISDGFLTYLKYAGVESSRVHRVHDWAHATAPTESVSESRARLHWSDGDFVGLHAGNMGQKQGLDNVLDAARLLRGEGVRIVLAGDGNDRPRLLERARQLENDNVSFLPLQAPGQYEGMLRAADVLILNQRASVGEMSLPSKLTSYFAAGRPVVAAVASESPTARLIARAQAGVIVTPDRPAALAEALLMLKARPEIGTGLGSRGKTYAELYLSPEHALSEYEDFLEQLVNGCHMSG